jgi:hypothetical protein
MCCCAKAQHSKEMGEVWSVSGDGLLSLKTHPALFATFDISTTPSAAARKAQHY